MPQISQFYGISAAHARIRGQCDLVGMAVPANYAVRRTDHVPPHFHARYAEYKAEYAIANGGLLAGSLPRRAETLVLDWLAIHRDELQANWDAMRADQAPQRIDPLP